MAGIKQTIINLKSIENTMIKHIPGSAIIWLCPSFVYSRMTIQRLLSFTLVSIQPYRRGPLTHTVNCLMKLRLTLSTNKLKHPENMLFCTRRINVHSLQQSSEQTVQTMRIAQELLNNLGCQIPWGYPIITYIIIYSGLSIPSF